MNILASINRIVKHQEKHLDIKVNLNGEEVDTLFSRFSSFSSDSADIELGSTNKKLVLHYDFNTGSLTEIKGGSDANVSDLFSSRHLRSLLFTAHKELFLKTTDNGSHDFATKFHNDYPQTVFCIENAGEKKWFSIESIDIIRDAKIKMAGLLSIEDTYVHQPIIARCEFDICRNKFNWEYKLDGKLKKETEDKNYYSWYKLKMSDVLYCFTEWKIDNPAPNEPAIVYEMLKVLKKQKFLFVLTNKGTAFSKLGENIINTLFWDIKSISDDEILFLACDGKTLLREITFNRNDRKIYAMASGLRRKAKEEFEFTNNQDSSKNKFLKVINLIEKELGTSR